MFTLFTKDNSNKKINLALSNLREEFNKGPNSCGDYELACSNYLTARTTHPTLVEHFSNQDLFLLWRIGLESKERYAYVQALECFYRILVLNQTDYQSFSLNDVR
jgi:hypothetical protein